MKVQHGKGKTEYRPGVEIKIAGSEVTTAIYAYLVAHGVHISGAGTVTVNGELCNVGRIYVDPSGRVVYDDIRYTGKGTIE